MMLKRIFEGAVMLVLAIIGLLPLIADSADESVPSTFKSLQLEVTSPEQGSDVGDEIVVQGDLTGVEKNGGGTSSGRQSVQLSIYWELVDDEKTGEKDAPAGNIPTVGEDVVGRTDAADSNSEQDYWLATMRIMDEQAEGDTITANWYISVDSETLKINEYPPGTQFKLFIELDPSENSGIEDFEINGVVDGTYELILVYRPAEQ